MAPLNVNQRRLRLLQGLAALIIIAAVGMFIIDGRPILNAVVGGATMGGLTFILTAAVLLMYWGLQASIER